MKQSILSEVKSKVKHWYLPLIVGILFIVLGFWTITTPVASFLSLALFYTIFLIISGISEIIFALFNTKELENWGWTLVMGIMNLAIGYMLFSDPLLTADFLAIYIGFLVLFRSITAIGTALDIKKQGDDNWGMMLFMAILGIIFAIILLRHPMFAGLTVVVWLSLAMFIIGGFAIFFSLRLRQLHKLPGKIKDALNQ